MESVDSTKESCEEPQQFQELVVPKEAESPSPTGVNPRYKTEICRNYTERAVCTYGDQCQFAHGKKELRDAVKNTKYKTKRCQKYWVLGYCAYGPRCNFLHNEEL